MFPQINRGTVVQCYRANELSYPRQKNTKKIQKDLIRKTAGISPKVYDQASVYTAPLESFEDINAPSEQYHVSMKKKRKKVIFNLCECNDNETERYHKPKTWDSITNYYGNADTTEIWAETQKRKDKRYKKEYPIEETNGEPTDNINYSKKHTRRSKTHKKRGHRFKSSFIEKCPDDECAEEAKKNKEYTCDCNVKMEPQLITTELSRNVLSTNSMAKIKDKFLCICHKYSQKVINMKPTNIDVINKDQHKISGKHNISKLTKKGNEIVLRKEHEGEQTGEPFFEIQVSPRDMCVLNPTEIKQNILKYGRPEKNVPKCICPSRGRLRPGEVCKSGPCKKAYKNKQINFNCWCDKKLAECGDATCDVVGIGHKRKKRVKRHIRIPRANKPLLEVQLDIDKMCVVNPKEIEEKIISNVSVDEICSSGVCREAALKNKTPYFCKCVRKKLESDITECSENTCGDATEKKKSKFNLLCTRIRSQSENWILRNRNDPQKRINRRSVYEISPNKLRKGKISTPPDNLLNDKQNVLSKLNKIQNDINIHRNQKNLNDPGVAKLVQIQEELKPYKSTKVKHVGISNKMKYKIDDVICTCAHQCECDINGRNDVKLEMKNTRYKEQQEKNKFSQKQRNKRRNDLNLERDWKKRVKADKKGEQMSAMERLKEIKIMQKKMQEEPMDTNFCTAFLLGILKVGIKTVFFICRMLYYVIRHPRKAYYYVIDRLSNPEATYYTFKQWLRDAVMIKKLEIANTVRGSDTFTILADHFLDTSMYQTLADKGATKEEQMAFEQKSKARKRRIRKREQQAIHSCRHALLTTLRQTPCLWVYHICPDFYPQCLSLLAFLRSFTHILMFLVAFTCWTPCILSFELCRAFLCCFMCTG